MVVEEDLLSHASSSPAPPPAPQQQRQRHAATSTDLTAWRLLTVPLAQAARQDSRLRVADSAADALFSILASYTRSLTPRLWSTLHLEAMRAVLALPAAAAADGGGGSRREGGAEGGGAEWREVAVAQGTARRGSREPPPLPTYVGEELSFEGIDRCGGEEEGGEARRFVGLWVGMEGCARVCVHACYCG
jgi:hypothetical protein